MEKIDILFAERDIHKQLIRFYTGLDECQFDMMASILTPDGLWRRGGVDIKGREMFLEAMNKRGADRHTRHILTNVQIDLQDETSGVAKFYSTAFVHVGPTDDKGVSPMALPSSIGIYTATFKRTEEGWQIADLRSKPSFKKQG
ncbi:hypothetical protein PMI07_006464 [Rhizobium sp. CF080]|uniref:nuclear transport factor 2 family protein n=1 Tax=Rhizobium sp. (strain CF080) TaxID=1144310 RepID=UPI000271787C|nr:nuclear transport factor 2 family protein [Rhizobium sp. CF080]EUB98150.1 hypothetical protein PMI07_006464 [Rhizobium sp. CF080]